jgi:DNA gyrase subunit A
VTLIALDEGAKLIGLQRIVENDANNDASTDEVDGDNDTGSDAADSGDAS